jgi:hypothetical protein
MRLNALGLEELPRQASLLGDLAEQRRVAYEALERLADNNPCIFPGEDNIIYLREDDNNVRLRGSANQTRAVLRVIAPSGFASNDPRVDVVLHLRPRVPRAFLYPSQHDPSHPLENRIDLIRQPMRLIPILAQPMSEEIECLTTLRVGDILELNGKNRAERYYYRVVPLALLPDTDATVQRLISFWEEGGSSQMAPDYGKILAKMASWFDQWHKAAFELNGVLNENGVHRRESTFASIKANAMYHVVRSDPGVVVGKKSLKHPILKVAHQGRNEVLRETQDIEYSRTNMTVRVKRDSARTME